MENNSSLESLLQTLLEDPGNRALTRTAIMLLREICKIHTGSLQSTAERVGCILDRLLEEKTRAEPEKALVDESSPVEFTEEETFDYQLANPREYQEDIVPVTDTAETQTEQKLAEKPKEQEDATKFSGPSSEDVEETFAAAQSEVNIAVSESAPPENAPPKTQETFKVPESGGDTAITPSEPVSPCPSTPPIASGLAEVRLEIEETHEDVAPAAEPKTPLEKSVALWNEKADPWLQIHLPPAEKEEFVVALIKAAAAVRNNLISAALYKESHQKHLNRFTKYWKRWQEEIDREGYRVYPTKFGHIETTAGDAIYTCRSRLDSQENILLLPGLKKGKTPILTPQTLVALPQDQPFPDDHHCRNFPPQWRGILGDLKTLHRVLETQDTVGCAIENISKTAVLPLDECREAALNEIKRRGSALFNTIRHRENVYRLATDYWRVEECFWGIFHNDGRPPGYSFFDYLRKKVQGWRSIIREENNLFIRDFTAGSDSLASIGKYIGNIILAKDKETTPGTVLREVRPAIIVKVNKVSRVLKGRVISS